MYSFALLSESF